MVFRTSCLYEIMRKNTSDVARQAMNGSIIRRIRSSCWMSNARDTLRIWNTYCFCTAATTVAQTRFIFFDMSVLFIVTLYPSIVFLFYLFYFLPCYLSTSTLNVHISVPYHRCLRTCVMHVFSPFRITISEHLFNYIRLLTNSSYFYWFRIWSISFFLSSPNFLILLTPETAIIKECHALV